MISGDLSIKIFRYIFAITLFFSVYNLTGTSFTAKADIIDTPQKIGTALLTCWHPPSGVEGLAATARFSFRRDGSLIAPPKITFSRLGQNDDRARAFLLSIADAFITCTPLNFTESFGQQVAGRIFTLRFLPALRRA